MKYFGWCTIIRLIHSLSLQFTTDSTIPTIHLLNNKIEQRKTEDSEVGSEEYDVLCYLYPVTL